MTNEYNIVKQLTYVLTFRKKIEFISCFPAAETVRSCINYDVLFSNLTNIRL